MSRSPTSTRSPRAANQMMDIAWRMSAHCAASELASIAGISRSAASRVVSVRKYTTDEMRPSGALLHSRPWLVALKAAGDHARAAGVVAHWVTHGHPPKGQTTAPPVEPLRQLALVPDGAPVRAQPVGVPFAEIFVKAPTPITDRAEPLSMSSKEIAELTGKMTYHVNRDIRTMLSTFRRDDPVLDHVREVRDERGYIAVFHLPKDLTLTLVSGYNVQMRHRIITRWLELEEASKPAQVVAPRTLSEALFLAATLAAEQENRRAAA